MVDVARNVTLSGLVPKGLLFGALSVAEVKRKACLSMCHGFNYVQSGG